MPEHSCALRALTLCDGQRLEDPERTLARCLCAEQAEHDAHGRLVAAFRCADERQELIERTLAPPLFS